MPTVWIVTSTAAPLTEIFQTAGWNVMLSEDVIQSRPRYPDVAIYPIEDESLLTRCVAFCHLKVMPVLALTSNWNLAWQAIEAGADDAIVAPISSAEVLFRARKLEHQSKSVCVDDLAIDLNGRRVKQGDRAIALSPVEFRLLACLADHMGEAVSFDQILDEVWGCGPNDGGTLEQVKSSIKRLRASLEPDPHHPQFILTIRSFGYRLRNQAQWEDNS